MTSYGRFHESIISDFVGVPTLAIRCASMHDVTHCTLRGSYCQTFVWLEGTMEQQQKGPGIFIFQHLARRCNAVDGYSIDNKLRLIHFL